MLTKNYFSMLAEETITADTGGSYSSAGVPGIFRGMYAWDNGNNISDGYVIFSGSEVDDPFNVTSKPDGYGPSRISVVQPSKVSVRFTPDSITLQSTFAITATTFSVTIRNISYARFISPRKYAIIDCTNLKEPITIASGDTRQVTYSISFKYPASPAALKAGK